MLSAAFGPAERHSSLCSSVRTRLRVSLSLSQEPVVGFRTRAKICDVVTAACRQTWGPDGSSVGSVCLVPMKPWALSLVPHASSIVVQACPGKAGEADVQGQAEEATQRYRLLAALAEELSLVPSTHIQRLTTA